MLRLEQHLLTCAGPLTLYLAWHVICNMCCTVHEVWVMVDYDLLTGIIAILMQLAQAQKLCPEGILVLHICSH